MSTKAFKVTVKNLPTEKTGPDDLLNFTKQLNKK